MQVSSSRFMPVSFAGDTVFGAGNESVFKVLGDFIGALEGGRRRASGAVSTALDGLDTSLDNVLTAPSPDRLAAGWRSSSSGFIGTDLDLQYATTLSNLQDLDYNEAISRLTQQQTYLQAAQSPSLKTISLSLFNFLS